MRWWRVVFETRHGGRRVGFIEANTQDGVRCGLRARYPTMRIIRVSEAKS